MVGLALAGLSTYMVVCYTTETQSEPGPRTVSWGGILGMNRGSVVVAWHTLCAGVFGLMALGVCDVLYARRTKARYFALHVICNIWISVLSAPDLYRTFSNPLVALAESEVNHWPTALVFSIHVYHMLFFSGLQFVDWLHHILMVVIGAPLLITGEVGPLANVNNFFMCGIPGGADYAMLLAVKHGWIEPLTEKNVNASINVWIRAPALIVMASFCYIQCFLQAGTVPRWVILVRLFLIALGAWNGLYFMERVGGNAHVNNYKAKLAKKASDVTMGGGAHKEQEESVYESSEHLAGNVPGFGVRVRHELTDFKKEM